MRLEISLLTGLLSVIIGALVSLSVVYFTNRGHNRRFREQLVHERDLKNREREMSLRRDVYLDAAEAVSAGLYAVGQFANLAIPHDKVTEGYLDKAPSIVKIYVIAKEETVRAVSNFSNELSATFMRLFAKRFLLFQEKQQIDFLGSQIETTLREQSRILELQKQYNIDGVRDPRKWELLQRNFEFEQRRLDENPG